jgi:prolyl-tRNA synthetase
VPRTQSAGTNRHALATTRATDFAGWYQGLVREADMAEMSHVRGCMVLRPWGCGIWEEMRRILDYEIKARGHESVYFPLFIPLSYLQKEADHVEGFAKEMAVVTHHRLEQRDGELHPAAPLDEPVVVRPTSETIIGETMAQWIQSYRDLPLRLNQWANVVRWEMRPRVLLRTTEFLWQEGHTAHASLDEAMAQTLDIHRMYRSFAEDFLAVPVIPGEKPPSERFPGAERSFSIEAMMQDGKALQAGTSHFLGQNFARASGITFLDQSGEQAFAHTTSWGVSTRLLGALAMTHGDDDGLCVPPRVAPSQVVVIPILRGEASDPEVLAYAREVAAALSARTASDGTRVRVRVDDSDHRPVDKKWRWIKRGVPLLLELGPRDVAARAVSVRRRISHGSAETRPLEEFVDGVSAELDAIQAALLATAAQRLEAGINRDAVTRADAEAFFKEDSGFLLAKWCLSPECEVALKPLGVTIRCIPTELRAKDAGCVICGSKADTDVILAKSY